MTDDLEIQAHFKLAMRRLTSTVSLITTRHDGRSIGMAATAVQSVTADPPVMLVCINQSASISKPLSETNRFGINILHISHEPLVPIFSGKLKNEARFEYGDWVHDQDVPILKDAQASMVCEAIERTSIGTHEVILGKVLSVLVREDIAPLLYENGQLVTSIPINA